MQIAQNINSPPKGLEGLLNEAEFPLVYHTREFASFLMDALTATVKWFSAYDDDKLVGILPWMEMRDDKFGVVINSLPWFGSHGGCLVSATAPDQTKSVLIHAFKKTLGGLKDDLFSATVSLSPFEEEWAPLYESILQPDAISKRIGQVTKLPAIETLADQQWMNIFVPNTRKQIRKAARQGFVLKDGDNDEGWDFLYTTHFDNMTAIEGKPKLNAHLDAFRRNIPTEQRFLTVAFYEDNPCAALLGIAYPPCIEYIMPVIQHEYRSMQPLTHIIAHEMEKAIEHGFLYWNFGGTWKTQETLHRFKAGWGAVDMPYTYLTICPAAGTADISMYQSDFVQAFPFFYIYPFA